MEEILIRIAATLGLVLAIGLFIVSMADTANNTPILFGIVITVAVYFIYKYKQES